MTCGIDSAVAQPKPPGESTTIQLRYEYAGSDPGPRCAVCGVCLKEHTNQSTQSLAQASQSSQNRP
jgi:hypothetical protein